MKSFPAVCLRLSQWKAHGIAMMLLGCTTVSIAGYVRVSIDSFAYVSSIGSVVFANSYQAYDASATNGGGLFGSQTGHYDSADWLPSSATASVAQASAQSAWYGDQGFYLNAQTGSDTHPPGTQSLAAANKWGFFTLLDSGSPVAGSVTFTMDYSIQVSAPDGNNTDNYTQGSAGLDVENSDITSGGAFLDQLSSFDFSNGTGTRNGQFVVTVDLLAGEVGYFYVSGSALAFSPVSEPGSMALCAGGLLALAWSRRRTSSKVSIGSRAP